MPTKLIKRANLNDWNEYSRDLADYPLVDKYLTDILKLWVVNVENPLDVFWIQNYFKEHLSLDWLNKKLAEYKEQIGENNLINLLEELKIKSNHSANVAIEIESIAGEIVAFNNYEGDSTNLKKMAERGDWENDEIVISVKTIMGFGNLNYDLIENSFHGIYYIKENEILREYNYFRLSNELNIDDSFRKKVIWFLQVALVDTIKYFDSILDKFCYLKATNTKFYTHNPKGYFEVECTAYLDEIQKTIDIVLSESREFEDKRKHQVMIKLNNHFNKPKLAIHGLIDKNTWWGDPPIDKELLKTKVLSKLEKFDKQFNNVNGRRFIGWINVDIHTKYRESLKKKDQIEMIKTDLEEIKMDRPYEVIVCLDYQAGAEAIILKI